MSDSPLQTREKVPTLGKKQSARLTALFAGCAGGKFLLLVLFVLFYLTSLGAILDVAIDLTALILLAVYANGCKKGKNQLLFPIALFLSSVPHLLTLVHSILLISYNPLEFFLALLTAAAPILIAADGFAKTKYRLLSILPAVFLILWYSENLLKPLRYGYFFGILPMLLEILTGVISITSYSLIILLQVWTSKPVDPFAEQEKQLRNLKRALEAGKLTPYEYEIRKMEILRNI